MIKQLAFEYTHLTIAERVLLLLREARRTGDGWVTTSDFARCELYTFRNRIVELKARGYRIAGERIKGKSIWRYRLAVEPESKPPHTLGLHPVTKAILDEAVRGYETPYPKEVSCERKK